MVLPASTREGAIRHDTILEKDEAREVRDVPVTNDTNRPLTLKELRAMEGEPVWVEVIDHSALADPADDFDAWGLVRKSWVRVWDAKRADLVHIDYDFEDYGSLWRAYRQRPAKSR